MLRGATGTPMPITARVSTGPGGGQLAAGSPATPNVDATGRYVFFTTTQPVVAADTNAANDVYRKDRLTGGVVRASLQGEQGQIPAGSRICGVSTSGRFVVFQTTSASADWSNQIWRRDLVGKTLGEAGLWERDITVLTLHRGVSVIPNPRKHVVLEADDRLFCFGKLDEMRSMIPERRRRRAKVRKLPKDARPDPVG